MSINVTLDESESGPGIARVQVSSIDELDKITKKLIHMNSRKEMKKLGEYIKQNIITEFKNSIGSTHFSFSDPGFEGNIGMPSEVVLAALEKMKVQRQYRDGKMKYVMVIPEDGDDRLKKGLVDALNNGTGIYGPSKKPITPKNKKYMFIPGARFARKLSTYVSTGTGKFQNKRVGKEIKTIERQQRTYSRKTYTQNMKYGGIKRGQAETKSQIISRQRSNAYRVESAE